MADFGVRIGTTLCTINVLSQRADAWVLANVPPVVAIAQKRFPEVLTVPVANHEAILTEIMQAGLTLEVPGELTGEFETANV